MKEMTDRTSSLPPILSLVSKQEIVLEQSVEISLHYNCRLRILLRLRCHGICLLLYRRLFAKHLHERSIGGGDAAYRMLRHLELDSFERVSQSARQTIEIISMTVVSHSCKKLLSDDWELCIYYGMLYNTDTQQREC